MNSYGEKSKSIPQKIVIHILEIIFLLLSYWILFQRGGEFIQDKFGIQNIAAGSDRRKIVFVFNLITFLRFAFMMSVMLKRRIPWAEGIGIPFAFALYFIGYSLLVMPTGKPIDGVDYFAMLLFAIGATLNTRGEFLRHRWKQDPANEGRLYTRGFFKYSMHINYFGDLLWVTAYAIITRNWYSVSIPIFLFCLFVFYNVPKLDRYLQEKYGKSFAEYAGRTKKFIPFIY